MCRTFVHKNCEKWWDQSVEQNIRPKFRQKLWTKLKTKVGNITREQKFLTKLMKDICEQKFYTKVYEPLATPYQPQLPNEYP